MNDHPFAYGPAINRCLHVFLEGPEKPFSNLEYSGKTNAGMHLFIWLGAVGFFRRHVRLRCDVLHDAEYL
jgi:hypothetical protein